MVKGTNATLKQGTVPDKLAILLWIVDALRCDGTEHEHSQTLRQNDSKIDGTHH